MPFPDLCSWGEKTCKKFLWDHGVLSADVPRCWVCGEWMSRTGRRMDDDLKCETPGCRQRPRLGHPVEAFTPLHSLARQGGSVDYVNFLRNCYVVGLKVPADAMAHLVTGVERRRLQHWCEDIRLACAVAEYQDSCELEFPAGVLEFDTATSHVQRKATSVQVSAALKKRDRWEKKGERTLKKKVRRTIRKRPAAAAQKIFRGRHIVFRLRHMDGSQTSRSYAILPLPPKISSSGHPAGGFILCIFLRFLGLVDMFGCDFPAAVCMTVSVRSCWWLSGEPVNKDRHVMNVC